jgi:hypothetical protein
MPSNFYIDANGVRRRIIKDDTKPATPKPAPPKATLDSVMRSESALNAAALKDSRQTSVVMWGLVMFVIFIIVVSLSMRHQETNHLQPASAPIPVSSHATGVSRPYSDPTSTQDLRSGQTHGATPVSASAPSKPAAPTTRLDRVIDCLKWAERTKAFTDGGATFCEVTTN